MSIKNAPIFAKIVLILSVFVMLVLASTVFQTAQMRTIGRSYADAIAQGGQASVLMSRSNRAATTVYASLGELTMAPDEAAKQEALDRIVKSRADALGALDKVAALGAEYAELAQRVRVEALKVINEDCANAISLGQSSSTDTAQAALFNECRPSFAPLSKLITAEVDKLLARQARTTAELQDLTADTVSLTYAVVIGGTILLLLVAFFGVRTWIARPIGELTTVMERLARGDHSVAIPGSDRRDEVGAMARTVQIFRDAALDKVRIEAQATTDRLEAEQQRAANDAAKAEQASEVERVVASLAEALGHMSKGDLSVRLAASFAPAYERLRADFNTAVQEMQTVLQAIVGSVTTIRSGTSEIAHAADDLSRRTEQQAASLEQTAAALEQITTTVKRAAESAAQARTVASRTRGDAEQSGLVVQNAVAAMSEIERSSQQISQIIGVIDEIAFQTNLLALNAGVEAARAGDAGRGFAVVASEVRALAQRSAEAAREIKTLISASTQQVGAGVKLVGDTGMALQRIVAQVGEVDTAVGEIAASAQEQALGLSQVNTAITEMDKVTQQNAAMVEQSTAAARALAVETEGLAQRTGHFRLGAEPVTRPEGRPAPRASSQAPNRQGPRPPPRRAQIPARALALVPESAEADWEEF